MPFASIARTRLADPRLLIAGIVLVGAVLRAESIGDHLSDAEGYSYLVGAAPNVGPFLHRLAAYENTPPLFYLVLTPLPLIQHTAWLRAPAAIPGMLIPLVLYVALRRPFGTRAALLSGGLVAVAPYHVSYSDYSRGFMLAALGCVLAVWAALRILQHEPRKWWLLYAAGAVIALYSEYDSAIFLIALILSLAYLTPRDRARTLVLGLLPFLALLPWVGEIVRGQNALNHTKISPVFPGPSPSSLRDVTVRLVFGEHGAGSGTGARWLEFLAILAVIVAAVIILRQRQQTSSRRAILLIGGTSLLLVVGHALAPIFGFDLFNERYLTTLIPFGAAALAATISQLNLRWLWTAAVVATALIAIGVFAQRFGRHYQPDLAPVRAAVAALHPHEVLTNTPIVAYYLRRMHPTLDRPFGLGEGQQQTCATPCVIVDDSRAPGGIRPGPGPTALIGPFAIRSSRRGAAP